MSHPSYEKSYEGCQERFDGCPFDYILEDKRAMQDLLCFVDGQRRDRNLQENITEWLNTPDGKKFEEKTIQLMYENLPDGAEE